VPMVRTTPVPGENTAIAFPVEVTVSLPAEP
jgi:hypothetical protein